MAIRSDAEIRGLDVTVNDALLVRSGQAFEQLNNQPQRFRFRDWAGMQLLFERHAWNHFHHQKIGSVLRIEIVHYRDVWMG